MNSRATMMNLRKRGNLSLRPNGSSNELLPSTRASISSQRDGSEASVVAIKAIVSLLGTAAFFLIASFSTAAIWPVTRRQQVSRSAVLVNKGNAVAAASFPAPNPPSDDGVYDVIVLGQGPAGLSAALFAARSTLSVLVLGSLHAGLLAEATSLDNFPSFMGGMTSRQWLQQTQQQARDFGATLGQPGLTASAVTHQSDHSFYVKTTLETYRGRALIVATGATPRRLDLSPAEDDLWGRSIHSCAICDGGAYGASDTVLVVGGGDAAVAAALYLSRRVERVIVVHRRDDWSRPKNRGAVQQMQHSSKIKVLAPYTVTEWVTSKNATGLTGVQLQHVNTKRTQLIDGIAGAFLMIGSTPNTDFIRDLAPLDSNGFIQLQHKNNGGQATRVAGLFAAGEVVDDGGYRQAITAAAQGSQAAMDAERWLAEQGWLEKGKRIYEPVIEKTMRTDAPRPEEECDLLQVDCLKHIVQQYPVVIFSKFNCPYCAMALEALGMEGAHPHVIELSYMGPKARQVQLALGTFTNGRTSVPNVFVGGKNIGGGQETTALHQKGALRSMLIAAGAIG